MNSYFDSPGFVAEIGRHLDLVNLLKLEQVSKKWRKIIRSTSWPHVMINLNQISHEMLKYKFTSNTIQLSLKICENYKSITPYNLSQRNVLQGKRIYIFKKLTSFLIGGKLIMTDRLFSFLCNGILIVYNEREPVECICIYLENFTMSQFDTFTDHKNNIVYNRGLCTFRLNPFNRFH